MIQGFKTFLKTRQLQHLRSGGGHKPVDIIVGKKELFSGLTFDKTLMNAIKHVGPYVPAKVVNVISDMSIKNEPVIRKRLSESCLLTYKESSEPSDDFLYLGTSVARYIESIGKTNRNNRVVVYYLGNVLGEKQFDNKISKSKKDNKAIKAVLSCKEINSGVTYGESHGDTIIIIYRAQEAEKVLAHELIHAYGFELDRLAASKGIELQKKWDIISEVPILLNETYVEILASFFYAHAFGIDIESLRDHFLHQSEKIMCMMTYSGEFRQKTHVFEYYIVKASMFYEMSAKRVEDIFDNYSNKDIIYLMTDCVDVYMQNFKCDLGMTR